MQKILLSLVVFFVLELAVIIEVGSSKIGRAHV